MKKIYIISAVFVIIGLIFTSWPEWFRFLWGWQVFLIPITAGIFMVLVQNENRSYRFLPKLIIGATLTSFAYIFVLFMVEYSKNSNRSSSLDLDIIAIMSIALPLIGICIFGGLIGIVIRGITLLLSKK